MEKILMIDDDKAVVTMTPQKKSCRSLRIVICGAMGRMGRRVADLAAKDDRFSLIAAIVRHVQPTSPALFPVADPSGAIEYFKQTDAVIDFSTPFACVAYAQLAVKSRKPIVIGTTGLTPKQTAAIRICAKKIPVFLSPNFSRGMNLLFHLAREAAAVLADYDADILEVHHVQKKDSPSGSALRLAEAVKLGRPDHKTVPIASQRLGDVVGEHTLSLAGYFERVELIHRAQSRDVFARGALDAALWLSRRRPGLYDMQDLLGFKKK